MRENCKYNSPKRHWESLAQRKRGNFDLKRSIAALAILTGAQLGGATLPPQHKLFSPRVEQSLRGLQINASTPRANFLVPTEYAKSKALTLANMNTPSGILECVNKTGDTMSLDESSTHLMLSFSCQGAILSPKFGAPGTTGNHSLVLAYDKAVVPTLFKYETGLKGRRVQFLETLKTHTPSAPIVSSGMSKDEEEMKACVEAFRAFKSQPATGYFRVAFVKRVYHCESGRSRELFVAHRLAERSRSKISLRGSAGASVPADLYVQHRVVNPDQHPPVSTQFDPAIFITYNSKPNPMASAKGAIHLKRPIEDSTLKLSLGTDAGLGWADAAIQVGTKRFEQEPLFVDGKPVDACQGWKNPQGLLAEIPGTAITRSNTPPVIGSPLERARQIATLDLSITELEDLAGKNGGDQQFYIRVVPLDGGHGCAAAPTKSVQVHLHDNYPQEKAEYDQILAENKAKAPFAANDGRGGAPFNVTVSTYVPFNLDDPSMYRVPTQILETRISSDQLNTFGIKHGGDWNPGCSFDPGAVQTWAQTDHSNLDSTLEKIWDDVLEVVEVGLTEYNALFNFVGEMIVYGATLGKCPLDDPSGMTPPAAGESDGCISSKKFVSSVIKVAFSYVSGGVNIASSASSLVSQGITAATNAAVQAGESAAQQLISAEIGPLLEDLSPDLYYQLASSLVQYGLGEGAKAGIEKLGQVLSDAATKSLSCSDPTASGALYPHKDLEDSLLKLQNSTILVNTPAYLSQKQAILAQFDKAALADDAFANALKTYAPGTYAFDDHQCPVQWGGNPQTWGKANPGRLDTSGMVFLKVTKNLSAAAAKASQFAKNQSITIYVTDRNGWYSDAYVRLSISKIPAGGLTVPLSLTPNLDKFKEQARLNQGYPAVYDIDMEQNLWMQGRLHDANPQVDIAVTGSYQWTDQFLTWNGNRIQVNWDRHTFPMNQNFNLKLPATPAPCRYCDKGDGSAYTCNQ